MTTLYSDAIDLICEAKNVWGGKHPEVDTPTDDDTDECINRELPRLVRVKDDEDYYDGTAQEIRDAVESGMDAWYGTVDKSAVEHYDQLDINARAEYRDNSDISLATAAQLDAIDAGRKAPCLS